MPVRILIVDPQQFFCEALAAILPAPNVDVMGWTTDELEASAMAAADPPDVVLTELELNSGSGLSLARRLRDGSKPVVLTRLHEGDVLMDVVSAGAFGCLSHDIEIDALRTLVVQAADGRFAVDGVRLHEILRRSMAVRLDDPAASKVARLTAREREVLRLLSVGLDNDAIARQLYLSTKTVRTHVGNILRKLGVHSRADAARVALDAGEGASESRVLRISGPKLIDR